MNQRARTYTFYDQNGIEYTTNNLADFCRQHELQRRHIDEVIDGKRKSHRGWSLEDPNGMTVEQVLQMAEIAANASEDEEYKKLVMDRVEKIRNGEPLDVTVDEELAALLHQ